MRGAFNRSAVKQSSIASMIDQSSSMIDASIID